MTQKQYVLAALDTIKSDLENAERCLESDEPFNTMTYLTNVGKEVQTAILHLTIHMNERR